MRKKVLGVKIDDISKEEALEKIGQWLEKKTARSFLVVTPGPEFLLTARNDREFRKILNHADLSLPDGFGLHLAGVRNRVAGVEFMGRLCELSAEKGWVVGLLGGEEGVAKSTASQLIKRYPNIKIAFSIDGETADQFLSNLSHLSHLKRVDILFAAFGHPKQERLLWKLKRDSGQARMTSGGFKVGMGVGGAFDYISGRKPAPPAIFRALGCEWLWRVLTQKNRIKRVFKAVLVFPSLILGRSVGILKEK